MRFMMLFALFALSAVTELSGQPTGALRWADSAQRVIHRAVVRGDLGGVRQAVTLIDRALGAFPNDPLLLHYRGFTEFRIGQLYAVSTATKDSATAYFESALEWMDRSIAVKPLAESYAVRASAMGQLMGGSMLAGVRYGAAASRADDDARALGAENPRVLLLQAIGTWFKPSMFGGGEDKARPLMARALAAVSRRLENFSLSRRGGMFGGSFQVSRIRRLGASGRLLPSTSRMRGEKLLASNPLSRENDT